MNTIETQTAPFRRGRGRPKKIKEESQMKANLTTDPEYLTKAEETGNKIAEMIAKRKETEKAEADEKTRKEAEKQFASESTGFKPALEEAGILKRQEELRAEIEGEINEEEKWKAVPQYPERKTPMVSKESVAEKKINDLIKHNEILDQEFEEKYKILKEKLADKKEKDGDSLLIGVFYGLFSDEYNDDLKKIERIEKEMIGIIDIMSANNEELKKLNKGGENSKIVNYLNERSGKIKEKLKEMKA